MEFVYKKEGEDIFGALAAAAKAPAIEAKTIFGAAGEGSAMGEFAYQQLRAASMAVALAFVEGGDYSFQAVSDLAVGMADLDENEELDDSEQEYVNELLTGVAQSFLAMGAESANVTEFMDNEDDDAGATLGAFLTEKLQSVTQDDEELIASYAASGDMVMESMVKVVRGGQVVLKKKRVGIPKKMTSLQRAALKKARSKAFTGAAKIARKKSMRLRKKAGL